MKMPPLRGAERSPWLLRLVANGLTQAACGLATLLLIRQLYRGGTDGQWQQDVTLLLLITLFSAWLRYRERRDAEALGQSYAHDTRLLLFRKLSSLPLNQLQRMRNGSQMLRFVGDLGALQLWIGRGVSRVATALITLATGIAGLAWFDYRLALTELAVILPLAVVTLLLGRGLQQQLRESRRRRSYLSANIHEKLAAIPTVQLFGQRQREADYLERQSLRLKQSMIKRAGHLGVLRATSELAIGGTLVALFSVSYLLENRPDSANLVMAFSLIILQTPALRQLSRVFEYWQGYRVSRDKITALLARPGYQRQTGPKPSTESRKDAEISPLIELKALTLPDRLTDIDATIYDGARIALSGPSGSGKSSLLLVLARLLEAPQGQICYRGTPITDLPLNHYRRKVGLVSQAAPLISGSIGKNLRYRRGTVPSEHLTEVLELCGLDPLLDTLPGGLDFPLRDGGRNLPRGQQFQIALARALIGRPELLLIDDADLGADPGLQQIITRVIASFPGTVIFAAHHQMYLVMADQCWEFQTGQLRAVIRTPEETSESKENEHGYQQPRLSA